MEKEAVGKHQFRERMKSLRDRIPCKERALRSRQIAERLLSLGWYEESAVVLVYSAIRSEVDLGAFCEQAWRDNKRLYFPRVEQASMEFYRADSPAQLVPGSFSVLEPDPAVCGSFSELEPCPFGSCGNVCVADGISQCGSARIPVLVPGVAFSPEGGRIGYGKGYYDRYLAAHPYLMPVGVCFEEQMAVGRRRGAAFGELEACRNAVGMECGGAGNILGWEVEAHDRRMEWIVTEREVYWVGH